ncbi:uncharacterized protein [Venturia canescens]|uniref:uncharacterized protein isoform X2 n=1 Tax=Venturia canescens TaxID=32260 RepID=UPI001C9C2E07|nr:uncharacterized protein LOC122415116 isoform X2 [Venturia canescens]
MPPNENNRCYVCKKLFCCSDCCTEHVKKKHPSRKSECPLCRANSLAVKNFDNQEFFCHVVFHHLPLYCRLCGVVYRNSKDLQFFGACTRSGFNCRLEKSDESIFSLKSPPSWVKTPCNYSSTRNQSTGTESDYNVKFNDLISPPELKRNTSTPMHVGGNGSKVNFVFKTPKSPNISIKTPKLSVQVLKNHQRNEYLIEKENSSKEASYKNFQSYSSSNESNYQSFSLKTSNLTDRTPLRSILSNKSIAMSDTSNYSSKSCNSGKIMLDVMQELDEDARIENFVTIPKESSPVTNDENVENQKLDSTKRVRFSDQFAIKSEVHSTIDNDDLDTTDNEIFYEARQSLSELSIPLVEKLSVSAVRIIDENDRNFEKEQKHEDLETPEDSDTGSKRQILDSEFKRPVEIAKPTTEASSSSSRVIMMVVVEKNGNLNSNELVPLLDSSLKKLVAGSSEHMANSLDESKTDSESTKPAPSILSVDSYMSFSAIERHNMVNSTENVTRNHQEHTEFGSGSSGGIFAAVANAVKVALRNFPGSRSLKNISREPVEKSQHLALLSATPNANTASSEVLTSLESALLPRNAKRSRDAEEVPSHSPSDSRDLLNDVRSPIPKKPRGWYKIRAREPIARMRTNSVIPSMSSELQQRLQLRSLSMDDCIYNLPSRIDQSTQTD